MSNEANIWQPRKILELSGDTKSVEELIVAEANQTLFSLSTFAYAINTGALEVHKNGLLLVKDSDWVEQSSTAFALLDPCEQGDRIVASGKVGIAANVDVRDTDIFISNAQALRDYAGLETTVYVQGQVTDADGGEATYTKTPVAAAPGTYVDNGITVIVPTGGDGSIAWLRELGASLANTAKVAATVADAVNGIAVDGTAIDYNKLTLSGTIQPEVKVSDRNATYVVKTAAQATADGDDPYLGTGSPNYYGANHTVSGGGYVLVLSVAPTLENFGATGGSDDSAALQALMAYCDTFGFAKVESQKTTFNVGDVVSDSVNINFNRATLKAISGASYVLSPDTSGYWDFTKYSDGVIDGNSKASNGIQYPQPYAGRNIFENMKFQYCDKGFYKPQGSFGNKFRNASFAYNDYGYFAVSSNSPLSHAGNDYFDAETHFGFHDRAAVYINSPAIGTGQTIFDGTIFEQNPGFGIFVEEYQGAGNPLELRNVWFEANHTLPSVDIEGTTYTPRDMHFSKVSQGKIYGTVIQSCYMEDSDFTIEQCKWFSQPSDFEAVNCKIRFQNCFISGDMVLTNCSAVAHDADILGTGTGYITDIEVITAKTLRNGLRLRQSIRLRATNATNFEGGTFITSYDGMRPFGALVPTFNDGGLFPHSLNGTASGTGRVDGYSFSVTANLYYYIKCEIKLNTGSDTPQCYIQGTGTVISDDFSPLLKEGEWVTVHLIGQATNTGTVGFWFNANGGNIDVSFGACTVVQVTDFSKIQRFYNDNTHIMQNNDFRFYASSLPGTINGAVQGDEVIKSNSTVDGNNMMLTSWRYDGTSWQSNYISTVSPAT